MVERIISHDALTLAVNDVFWGCSVLFVCLIPILWLARPPFASGGPETMH